MIGAQIEEAFGHNAFVEHNKLHVITKDRGAGVSVTVGVLPPGGVE